MSNETVVVASKLPMALDLQICKSRVERRQDRSTVWEETVYYKDGPVVTINGTAVPRGNPGEGEEWPEPPQILSGAALTFNVPKDFFDEWMRQNATTDMVKNGLIFAAKKRENVVAQARDHKTLRSGLEPLRPDATGKDADKRVPKKVITGPLNRNRGSAEAEAVAE